jgi:hypothetical protein
MNDLTEFEVIVTDPAQADSDSHYQRLMYIVSPERANIWYAGLLAAFDSLRTLPNRCPIAPEDYHFPEVTVRQYIYGNKRRAYRILYHVVEPEVGEEVGVVRVLRVLHGAQPHLGSGIGSEEPE